MMPVQAFRFGYIHIGLHFAGVALDGGGGGIVDHHRVIIGALGLGFSVLENMHYDQAGVGRPL